MYVLRVQLRITFTSSIIERSLQLRTTVENKKRENGEDFNLHPPPLSHPSNHPPSPRLTTHPALSFAELESLATFSRGAVYREDKG